MTLYMLVSKDKYELSLVIADSVAELGRKLSIPENRISSAMSHAKKRGYRSSYIKVEIEDDM